MLIVSALAPKDSFQCFTLVSRCNNSLDSRTRLLVGTDDTHSVVVGSPTCLHILHQNSGVLAGKPFLVFPQDPALGNMHALSTSALDDHPPFHRVISRHGRLNATYVCSTSKPGAQHRRLGITSAWSARQHSVREYAFLRTRHDTSVLTDLATRLGYPLEYFAS
jgi:hypothetical protein